MAASALGWKLKTFLPDEIARFDSAPEPIDMIILRVAMLSPDQAQLDALGCRWTQWHAQQGYRLRGSGQEDVSDG